MVTLASLTLHQITSALNPNNPTYLRYNRPPEHDVPEHCERTHSPQSDRHYYHPHGITGETKHRRSEDDNESNKDCQRPALIPKENNGLQSNRVEGDAYIRL